ncbi:MAG: GFA family protein [Limisphaerales bacterium]
MCPHCGSRLTVGEDARRKIIGLTASSLDDPSGFKPVMDIFVRDAQPWDIMDAALPKYTQYMPRG